MTSNNGIMDGTNIDTSVFLYTAPRANPTGGKVVNLLHRDFKESRESLTITTPKMLTWGAQEALDTLKNPTGKYTMSLQFPSADYTNPQIEAFFESLKNLQAKIKADALIKSREWFGKNITSEDVIDVLFNTMFHYPKIKNSTEYDYTKPPYITIKLPCWKNIWQSEIYDEDKNPLFLKDDSSNNSPISFLTKGIYVSCCIQCGGLWFVNGKVSIVWNLKQAKIFKMKSSPIIQGVCVIKDEVEEDNNQVNITSSLNNEKDIESESELITTIVSDSDDEELPLPPPPADVQPPADVLVPQVVPPINKKKNNKK